MPLSRAVRAGLTVAVAAAAALGVVTPAQAAPPGDPGGSRGGRPLVIPIPVTVTIPVDPPIPANAPVPPGVPVATEPPPCDDFLRYAFETEQQCTDFVDAGGDLGTRPWARVTLVAGPSSGAPAAPGYAYIRIELRNFGPQVSTNFEYQWDYGYAATADTPEYRDWDGIDLYTEQLTPEGSMDETMGWYCGQGPGYFVDNFRIMADLWLADGTRYRHTFPDRIDVCVDGAPVPV